jgi:hypothetical protein
MTGYCVRLRTEADENRPHAPPMDWIAAAVEWRGFRGEVRAHWTRLTPAQLDTIAGKRGSLSEQICASYHVTHAEAERQIASFEARNSYFRAASSR